MELPDGIDLTVIAAIANGGVIGIRGGGLPWHLPEDLRRFRSLTMGKPMIMGRKTHLSIGRVLPGRPNIVLSSSIAPTSDRLLEQTLAAKKAVIVSDLGGALKIAQRCLTGGSNREIAVIGGGSVYEQTVPLASTLYITRILADYDGDVCFPAYRMPPWQSTEKGEIQRSADNPELRYYYETLKNTGQ